MNILSMKESVCEPEIRHNWWENLVGYFKLPLISHYIFVCSYRKQLLDFLQDDIQICVSFLWILIWLRFLPDNIIFLHRDLSWHSGSTQLSLRSSFAVVTDRVEGLFILCTVTQTELAQDMRDSSRCRGEMSLQVPHSFPHTFNRIIFKLGK